MTVKNKWFTHDDDITWEELGGGLKRKIMTYDENMMLVKVAFEKGGVGALHSHYHTQMSYVESGTFEITIDGKTETLVGGDTYYIPPNLVHGAFCLEKGVLVDVFNPHREDFVV